EFVSTQFDFNAASQGWFVSSGLLGSILGVLIAGLLSDRIGRKSVLLLTGVTFLLSGVGCALASSAPTLIVYRLVGGIGVGIASVVSPMYITEFAPSRIRGRMVAFYQLAITLGILAAYLSNAGLLSWSGAWQAGGGLSGWVFGDEVWRSMFLVMAIPSLLFIAMIAWVPESPRWLIAIGRRQRALAILKKTQCEGQAVETYTMIESAAATRKKTQRSIFIKNMRIPLLIGILLCIFQQFSGINAIIYYGPSIFTAAGLTNDNALHAQVIIGVVNVVFTIVAITQSDRFGRKPLLVLGLGGMIISLITVGICFYTGYTEGILVLGMLVLFIACFALSVGPVTCILINEIFPDDLRVAAVSIYTFALWVAVWVVGQFFPWLLEQVGPAGVFWVFA